MKYGHDIPLRGHIFICVVGNRNFIYIFSKKYFKTIGFYQIMFYFCTS